MLTRDVDKTITNILEGKVQYNEETDVSVVISLYTCPPMYVVCSFHMQLQALLNLTLVNCHFQRERQHS